MTRVKWTDAEIRHLSAKMDTTSRKVIAEDMGRSLPAINQMASKIKRGEVEIPLLETDKKKASTPRPARKIRVVEGQRRNNKRWTNKEILYISRTLDKNPKRVARKLKRTVSAVEAARYSYLNGSLRPSLDRESIVIKKWWKRILFKR